MFRLVRLQSKGRAEAGFPATNVLSGTSRLTTDPAATTHPLPIRMSGRIVLPAPMTVPRPTRTFPARVAPGPIEIFVVQTVYIEPTVSAVRFMAPPPQCFTATYLGDTYIYPTIGNSQTGAWVIYGPCASGTVLVMTITFFGHGTSGHCCWYGLQPYPGSGDIESEMCGSTGWYWTHGEGIYISTDPSKNCGTPVEQTTWGGIKAMYR